MKIIIEKRKSTGGKLTLRLVYYYGHKVNGSGKVKHIRDREKLDLFLYEKPRTSTERQHNKEVQQLAEAIKAKRLVEHHRDGTFSDNTQGGIISGGSVSITGASQGDNTGRWSTNNEVVTFQYNNGKQQRYSMSYAQGGLLYLDNYRHFVLEHDDDVCN